MYILLGKKVKENKSKFYTGIILWVILGIIFDLIHF